MRRRLRRRPAQWKALTSKSTYGKPPGLTTRGLYVELLLPLGMRGSAWIPRGKRLSSSFLQDGVGVGRYTLPPLLQGHPPHPDAPLLLASLRRAPGWAP